MKQHQYIAFFSFILSCQYLCSDKYRYSVLLLDLMLFIK